MKKKRIISLGCMMMSLALAGSAAGCGNGTTTADQTEQDEYYEQVLVETGNAIEGNHPSAEDTQHADAQDTEDTEGGAQEANSPQAGEDGDYEEIVSDEKLIDYEGVVIIGNAAYEVYNYREDTATTYVSAVNSLETSLSGIADIYNIIIPLSSEITFPDNRRGDVNSSNQKESIDKINANLHSGIKQVNVYDALMRHRKEYIYFRTDHHWTALGAYYAYDAFCRTKGITANALDAYETVDYEGYLGSFYKDTKNDPTIGNTPDVVTAYKPISECKMHVTPKEGDSYDWPVIQDVTSYKSGYKYSTFIAGDNPFTVITNQEKTDGSSCVVVKESFGNAFVPFLVDHYQTVYVIDYRYWKGSLVSFVKENEVQDVILANNLSMIRNKYLVGQLQNSL